jgi:dihydrofolate reductase
MSRLVVTTFLSLDGVMQAPGAPDEDTSGGFTQGGWTFPYADEDFGRFVVEWITQADAFLLGQKTYGIFAAYWPGITDPDNPIAKALNSLPKYVVSNTMDKAQWNNTTIIRGNVVEEIKRLKDKPGRELQVHGSGVLAQTLMDNDLVDEYRLWFFPVILGGGKRLFPTGIRPKAFKLKAVKTTVKGIVIVTYLPAGKPAYGSFVQDKK